MKHLTASPGRLADPDPRAPESETLTDAAATLGFALLLGTDPVREDLLRLAASLSGTGR